MLTELIESVIESLAGRNYERIASESDLQRQVESRLRVAKLEFSAQVQLCSVRDRVDVLCDRIAIELKTNGVASSVLSQLERYAQSDLVDALLLVTTKASHLKLRDVRELHGKPLYVIVVGSL